MGFRGRLPGSALENTRLKSDAFDHHFKTFR